MTLFLWPIVDRNRKSTLKHLILILSLSVFGLVSCGQKQMRTPDNAFEMFEEFKKKEKFLAQPYPNYYSGLPDADLKPILASKIDQAANGFLKVAESDDPTEEKYHAAIDLGLSRFNDVYWSLDSEELDRIGTYFEELMDIVGLESSGGRLNKWRYWFDPPVKK